MRKWSLLIVVLALLACSGDEQSQVANRMKSQYSAIKTKYDKLIEEVNSDSAYHQLLADRERDLEKLLENYGNAESTDEVELIRSQVLIDLEKYDLALEKLNGIIHGDSELLNQARFQKVRILQAQDNIEDALTVFKKININFNKNVQYYRVLFNFAFEAPGIKDRKMYSKELLSVKPWPEDFLDYKPYVYGNLSQIARAEGNLEQAKSILQDGIADLKKSGRAASLESTLQLTEMIGKPAPALSAETWVNSESLELSDLRGRAVVIDFWAPWCAPCRAVIPTIVDEYNNHKDDGLVVIGYTRLYGQYRDDKHNAGEVSPDEEIGLTTDFVERFGIEYPVAIAHNTQGFETYFIRGIPTMIFIDRDGRVADFKIGSGNEKYIRQKIAELVG